MKGFFGRMNFPRAVILTCSFGSLVLGGLVYLRTARLSEIESQLRRVRDVLKEIQTDAYRLSDLLRAASAEKFKTQDEPEAYIRGIAAGNDTKIGQVDIQHHTSSPFRGVEDRIFKIKSQIKNQRFRRVNISNFLYKLEADSRRVKVTSIKLTPFEKLEPGELGKDEWVFEVELTSRSKVETGAGTPSTEG